jgi:PAS domain S-box-containing protein
MYSRDLAAMGTVLGIPTMTPAGSAESLADEKFRLAVEACPSGMVISDGDGTIVLVNSETERIFGYGRNELIGQSIDILVPERLRKQHLRFRGKFAEHPLMRRVEGRRGLLGLRRDGSEFAIEIGLNPIRTRDGLFVLSIITDIADRQRMDRVKDEFVSNVSHELRTPLTSIAGSLGLLLGGAAGQLPQQATRLLTIAQNNCQRLIRLINDILDIEKAESGKLEFHFKRLDMRALAEHVLEANRAYADTFNVTLRLDPAASGGEVYADPDRLAQALTNVLSNAIKFSPAHGEVLVSIAQREHTVRLAVRDHGRGIPKEFRPRLFERFAQANTTDARQRSGTGLGLSIVRQIVGRLGGTVGFEDGNGGGTICNIDLPSWGAIAAREIDAARAADAVPVLLCEDDPDLAMALREGLRALGFSIDFAHDPVDAVARATSDHYAALVVDLKVPGAGGLQLIRRLREQPRLYRTPIAIIGAERESDPDEAAHLFVLGWIEKPVDIARLGQLLEKARVSGANGRPLILHIDGDAKARDLVAHALQPNAGVVSVKSGEEARRAIKTEDFDLAILDAALDPGLTLLTDLHDRRGRSIPVVTFSLSRTETAPGRQVAAQLNKSLASLDDLVEAIRDRLTGAGSQVQGRSR